MPTLSVQPDVSRPVPKGECFVYCIIPFEYVQGGGLRAEASVTFDGTSYPAGQKFTFVGVEFTTTAGTITYKSFPITANALNSAEAFKSALELNGNFFGVADIEVLIVSPGVYRTRARWPEGGEVSPWVFDYSTISPEPVHSETNGTPVQTVPGMLMRYQLYAKRGGDLFAVTGMEAITPRITGIGGVPRMCLDFKDDLKGLVSVTFPGAALSDIEGDPIFSISVFLKYGVYRVDDCVVTDYNLLATGEVTLLNSAVQIDDVLKLRPFNRSDSNPVDLLTSRPQSIPVPGSAYLWAWAYCTHLAVLESLERYRANWKYYDSAGALLLEVTSATEPVADGVYLFPTGPGNSPTVPPGTTKVVTRLEVYHNVFEQFINASEAHTVLVGSACAGQEEFYFVEDLGGYGTIHFDEVEEVTHFVENQTFASGEICVENLYLEDLGSRLLGGGLSRSNILSWRVFRATVRGMDSPELERWFRQFCDSENVLWRYTSDAGDEVIRKVIIEPGETVIRRDGEYLTLQVIFRQHTNLR